MLKGRSLNYWIVVGIIYIFLIALASVGTVYICLVTGIPRDYGFIVFIALLFALLMPALYVQEKIDRKL